MTENARIHNALAVVKKATEASASEWVLGGSTSLMLRGFPLSALPRDLDIYCDEENIDAIHKALEPYALDQPAISETGMYHSILSHYLIHDIQVELVGGFQVKASGCHYETMVRKVLLDFSDHIYLSDVEVTVPIVPLAHELWFNFLRDRMDRVDLIVQAFAEAPALHGRAMHAIEAKNSFTAEALRSLHLILSNREAGGL
ncbi:hypothetical protein [Paenibacillus sp. LHD-38]|uniref:hypothetical protein n=1 Tax=Paenibacillus sp. LHD-38 TaxID=3072143 RepID=UPI00280D0995|nr:hypothetical protein [Paenibacillus sp. LHD-38]MDQ8735466.1 hypothetical protein [Paenibacillus sp. LHD-38]